jgi:hypothetical protein
MYIEDKAARRWKRTGKLGTKEEWEIGEPGSGSGGDILLKESSENVYTR